MSVLKSQRKESKFEVFHHFYKMRKEITNLVYRNFGYKGTSDFERWLIDGEAKAVLNSLREAQKFITLANSIFPVYLFECDERRKFQDCAIGLHFQLLQELQFILESLPIDKNSYVRFAEMINKEIALLKEWRQSDNVIRKKIENKKEG